MKGRTTLIKKKLVMSFMILRFQRTLDGLMLWGYLGVPTWDGGQRSYLLWVHNKIYVRFFKVEGSRVVKLLRRFYWSFAFLKTQRISLFSCVRRMTCLGKKWVEKVPQKIGTWKSLWAKLFNFQFSWHNIQVRESPI